MEERLPRPRRSAAIRDLRPSRVERDGGAPLLGAHVSIAGGMACAIDKARALGCSSFQVFVKNQQQWQGRKLEQADLQAFQALGDEEPAPKTLAHASYLINLASPEPILWKRSRLAMLEEMRRCSSLGIGWLVLHPGSHVGSGEQDGLRRIAHGLRWLLKRPQLESVGILLECTAGQGTSLGHRFEHLAQLLEQAGPSSRLGLCLDTCHLLAAGYEIRSRSGYGEVFTELDRMIGLERVRAFHLNDSKKPLGSRVDRHARIGEGYLGRAFFRRLLRDERFIGIPMILETPGGQAGYRQELRLLRSFLRGLTSRS